jgi:hypothetical protein
VWKRLAHLPIEERDLVPRIEVDGEGAIVVPCGTHGHRALVDGGALVLLDHDLEAELALLALGASVPSCLVHAALWDEGVVGDAFLEQWAEDVEGDGLVPAAEEWRGNFWEPWPTDPPAARVLFGPRLQVALALTAAQDRARPGRPSPPSRPVQRAVQRRARRAFVASLAAVDAHRRPDALVPVAIRVGEASAGAEGRLAEDASGVTLHLRPDWLWSVWADGGGLHDGRFVLARDETMLQTLVWRPSGRPGREHLPHVESVPRAVPRRQ